MLPVATLDSGRILAAYAALLSAVIIQRASTRELSLTHFTYWGLLLSLLLALAWLTAMALDGATWTGRVPPGDLPTREGLLLVGASVPVLGVLFSVATLITAMPILDVSIIVSQGGDTSLAIINVANIAIHYLPPVVMVIVLHMRWALVGPLAIATIYSSTIDFNAAYGVRVSPLAVYGVALGTLATFAAVMHLCFEQAMVSGGPTAEGSSKPRPTLPGHSATALLPYVLGVGLLFLYRNLLCRPCAFCWLACCSLKGWLF